MNSLRISQSCYAQLTSVYTNNVKGIVEFQLDNLCCFTGDCLTRKNNRPYNKESTKYKHIGN